MTCERCFQPTTEGEHGLYHCPLQPRDVALFVSSDGIPGGLLVEHGLCNPDGSPRRYYSKSDMRREAKARGLVNWVEHRADNRDGDKSAHTQRFV